MYTVYKDKKVFLTGHTGFKGSWMLCWLHSIGAKVMGYSLAPDQDNTLYNSISGNELCNSVTGDIRDAETLSRALVDFEPDFVFHLAAQALVRESYQNPVYTYEVNVIGTANILNAVRQLNKPCVTVIITTDKVYDNREWVYPYRETDRLGGYDPYSSSKACCEILVDSFRNSFFNAASWTEHGKVVATARAGNVIGGGDRSRDRIIPDVIKAAETNKPLILRNPSSVRPWQHVLEPVSGYLMLGEKLFESGNKYSGAWNFGPYTEDCLTVGQIVDKAKKSFEQLEVEIDSANNQPHEAHLLKLDINKTVSLLGWTPRLTAEKAIDMTFQWYKNEKNVGAYQLVANQIQAYEDSIS